MAWDKSKCAEGILAPNLNDEIRANWDALEAALTKEMNFSTGEAASLQGILKQGGARCFFQATPPLTRIDGSAFASTDNGSVWVDSDNNKLNMLTDYSGPTWTSVESVTIATLLAAARVFAEIITFSKNPVFTLGIVGNNSYLQGRNAAGDANINMVKVNASNLPEILVGAVLSADTAPASDAAIANKKYVDDQIVAAKEDYIKVSDQVASGVGPQANASGAWTTRRINTENHDDGGRCSIAGNQITLVAGTYRCQISAPVYYNCRQHQIRLRNITDGNTALVGTSEYQHNDYSRETQRSFLCGQFTIADTKVFEVQHYKTAGSAFGSKVSLGEVEVYTIAEFWKIN